MRTEKIVGGIIALLFLVGAGLIAWQVLSDADEDSPAAMQAQDLGPAGRGDELAAVIPAGDAPTAPGGALESGPVHMRIYGTVTERRGGAPIAGAEVRLQQPRPGGFGGAMTPPGQAIRQRGEAAALTTTETTERGSYSIELEWTGGEDEPLPQLVLACVSEGHASHEEVVPIHGRSELRMDIQLQRAAGVSGRVVRADARGEGVEGVQVMAGQGGEWMWGGEGDNTATTGEDGAFNLADLSPGRYALSVSGLREHNLHFPAGTQAVYVDEGERVEGVELEVEEGGQITGRVSSRRGAPIAGASVELTPTRFSTQAMETLMLARDARAETDDEGVYTIAGLPPEGEFSVRAQAMEHAPSERRTVTLTERARTATADFVLGEGSTISGRIMQADGEPFAEGGIQLQSLDMQSFDMGGLGTQTGEDGSFTLEHVAPGRYTVTAGWWSVETEDGETATLTVEEGRDLGDLRLVLAERSWGEQPEADGVITGRVRDSRGNPVEDAAVTASMGAFPAQTVSTTDGGAFTIENLWPGNYTVEAQARGEIAREEGVPLHADIRLNLSPGARIAGLVLDSEGDVAEGVGVTLINLEDQAAEDDMAALLSQFEDFFAEGQRRTDGNGAFEFGDLRPGQYRVEARHTTLGTGQSDVITLTRGQERSGVRVRLERGVRVTGRVQDPTGRAVSGAQVRLARATDNMMAQAMESAIPAGMGGGSQHSATTNRQGEFEIANVPPGSYDLVATHRSYARNRLPGVTVRRGADTHGLRVVMSEGGSVRGRLTDSSGEPISGGVVLMGPGGFHMVTAGGQGEFSIGGLASGSYLAVPMDTTQITAGGGGSQAFPEMGVVDVTDGEAADLDFGPTGDIPVSGRISNYAGDNAVVSVRRPGGPHPSEMSMTQIGTTLDILRHQAGQAVVQPDGSFQIEGLAPGDYTVDVLRFDEQAAMRDPMNFRMESLYEGPLSVGDSGAVELDIALP